MQQLRSIHILSWCQPDRGGSAPRIYPNLTVPGTDRKITPLSFSEQAAASRLHYVFIFVISKKAGRKRAEHKLPNVPGKNIS